MSIRLTILLVLFSSLPAFSTPGPSIIAKPKDPPALTLSTVVASRFTTMKIKEIEKIAGRKLKLKEKFAIKLLQWKVKKDLAKNKKGERSQKGKTALILSIAGVGCLLIPYLALASIPLVVLGLILGYQARKINPGDKRAKAAITIGWVGIILFLVVVALVVAILASFGSWGWG
ncbi:MAG: hypothetical protein JNM19_05685 [Chitinophagaceae bacterium]|nr:hypothetical protein [Chitinophagaceae bacterium]